MTRLYAVDINQLRNASTEDLEKLTKWMWLLHQLAAGELQSREEHQDALPGQAQSGSPTSTQDQLDARVQSRRRDA
jgi:hypothetical protein